MYPKDALLILKRIKEDISEPDYQGSEAFSCAAVPQFNPLLVNPSRIESVKKANDNALLGSLIAPLEDALSPLLKVKGSKGIEWVSMEITDIAMSVVVGKAAVKDAINYFLVKKNEALHVVWDISSLEDAINERVNDAAYTFTPIEGMDITVTFSDGKKNKYHLRDEDIDARVLDAFADGIKKKKIRFIVNITPDGKCSYTVNGKKGIRLWTVIPEKDEVLYPPIRRNSGILWLSVAVGSYEDFEKRFDFCGYRGGCLSPWSTLYLGWLSVWATYGVRLEKGK